MRNVESVAGCTFDALGLLKHVCPFRHVDVVPGCNRRKDEVFVGPVLAAPEVADQHRLARASMPSGSPRTTRTGPQSRGASGCPRQTQ